MAKRTRKTTFKGELSVDTMRITEVGKDFEHEYDFLDALHDYDGATVQISITEDQDVAPVEE